MSHFKQAHIDLVAKAIEELSFEEMIDFEVINSTYVLRINNQICYAFHGKISIWSGIQVKRETLVKLNEGSKETIYFDDFFREVKDFIEIDDKTLAQFIEEGNQTIFSDVQVLEKYASLPSLIDKNYNFTLIDSLCSGHPKLILNKGRIGWGVSDLGKYAPESQKPFQLKWLIIKKKALTLGFNESFDYSKYLVEELGFSLDELSEDEIFIPVHPWQWDHYLKVQFGIQISNGDIRESKQSGPFVTPQVSIRTMSVNGISQYDIKLSLSILNTSCVRGIPHRYIESGQLISNFMQKIVQEDPKLSQMDILEEVGAFAVKHRSFNKIEGGSYRFKELLGGVFRESVATKLNSGERAIPVAGLLINHHNFCFVKELIEYSGLIPSEWVRLYVINVLIPLYHLQVVHGIGLVAHGQNTILKLKNHTPVGVIIKDFHGDLRISTQSKHKESELQGILDELPTEYLIHDLFTGHFVTTLRYLSRILDERSILIEKDFYKVIFDEVKKYLKDQPTQDENNLIKEKFEKVLVNKVRFKMGYDETALRLKPMLGQHILNPIGKGVQYESRI